MSDTMTEGTIAAWHKKVGDKVKSGDLLAEVETDKATMELESYNDGTLLHIGVQDHQSVAVDGLLAIVGNPGENIDSLLAAEGGAPAPAAAPAQAAAAPAPAPASAPAPAAAPAAPAPAAAPASNPNATRVTMPKMSDTMTEGTIAAWHKKVGDKVKSGELLAEVETDKATMELESYEDGTLLYIGPKEGEAVAVDGLIAIIGKEGTDVSAMTGGAPAPAAAPASAEPAPQASAEPAAAAAQGSPEPSASSDSEGRLKISPLARKVAEEKGFKLNDIKGSGENGRIVKRDVDNYKPAAKPAATASAPAAQSAKAASPAANAGQESFTEVPVSQMRKAIARRLSESLFTAPHFYLTMEINMDKAIEARKSINEYAAAKISFNDFVLKAVAMTLKKHPKVNSSWLGDKIRYNNHVHIGVAVAVEEGLLVPVVRFADTKSLTAISAEVKDLGTRAKNKQLQPAEWEGNTFTISNLGMFGIDEFTAIINPPDACILAVGGIKETVIVKDGEMKVGNLMKVTMSCDHRVVDGAVGSAFLQTLKALLEDPIRILA